MCFYRAVSVQELGVQTVDITRDLLDKVDVPKARDTAPQIMENVETTNPIDIPTLEEWKIIQPTTGAAPRRLDQQRPRAMEMASITKRKNGIQTRRN